MSCSVILGGESILGNPRPLLGTLQSTAGTIIQKMDQNRQEDNSSFGHIVWRVEDLRWSYRHGQIHTR